MPENNDIQQPTPTALALAVGSANISLGHFCSLLIKHRIIDAAAIEDPEGYDGGTTAANCFNAYKEMDANSPNEKS